MKQLKHKNIIHTKMTQLDTNNEFLDTNIEFLLDTNDEFKTYEEYESAMSKKHNKFLINECCFQLNQMNENAPCIIIYSNIHRGKLLIYDITNKNLSYYNEDGPRISYPDDEDWTRNEAFDYLKHKLDLNEIQLKTLNECLDDVDKYMKQCKQDENVTK